MDDDDGLRAGTEADAAAAEPAVAAEPAPEEGPAHGSVRYTAAACSSWAARSQRGSPPSSPASAPSAGRPPTRSAASSPTSSAHSRFAASRRCPTSRPTRWVVKVDGLVDSPLTIDHAKWTSLQRMKETVDFHCVEGWGVDAVRWGGVAPSVLLDQAGVKPEAKYVVFHAYGGEYKSSLPLDLVRDSETMLADSLNGLPLPPKHGGPLRLVVPKQLGYKNVKWVERIELSDQIVTGYWEGNGYPEDAPVPGG